MSAEVLEKVGTALYRTVQVESGYAPGRTGDESVGPGQHHGRPVEGFHETGSHDAHDALVPFGIVDYGGVAAAQASALADHFKGLPGNLAVDVLALVVVVVYLPAYRHGPCRVGRCQQLHGEPA